MRLWKGHARRSAEIQPEEIFLDSSNIPEFDRDQFEGRIERPISKRSFAFVAGALALVFCFYIVEAGQLQLYKGEAYAKQALENQLARTVVFADRGFIVDRQGREIATNIRPPAPDGAQSADYSVRSYEPYRGVAAVVGYAKGPAKDSSGAYFRESSIGMDGVEAAFNDLLAGVNGLKLTETNAKGKVVSESTLLPPEHGGRLTLSIDAKVSQAMYDAMADIATRSRFQGGAGLIMDVHTGELLAMVSYPEFSMQTLADGEDRQAIAAYLSDSKQPFLDRSTQGTYAPGSIVKPIVAMGALEEGVIDEYKQILSTGSISIPNPYFPDKPTVFRDWKAHGYVDMRHAIAASSDVYFYEVGGGYGAQKGLGIEKLDKYFRMFGFSAPAGLSGFTEATGSIPTPEWKAKNFPDDPVWRVGNTYHTAIGQYGVTITPLQAVRAAAAIANNGLLLKPTLLASSTPQGEKLPVSQHSFDVAHEGMRLAAGGGTAAAVNVPFMQVAGKTGTAQVGSRNEHMNSWVIGFFPYENPKYAFAMVLEKAPAGTLMGAPAAMRQVLDWMHANAPEYVEDRR